MHDLKDLHELDTVVPAQESDNFRPPMVGDSFGGDWRVEKIIHQTNVSSVSVLERQGVRLALKVVRPSFVEICPEFPVANEAHIMLAYGEASGLPRLYKAWERDDRLFLVMQYIGGESLKEYLDRQPRPLPVSTIVWILRSILERVRYLHSLPRPILHLDIKKIQIKIWRERVWLLDFGLAVHKDGPRWQPPPGCFCGAVGYVAPEHLRAARNIMDERADVFAIGVIGYLLVAGRKAPPKTGWPLPSCAPLPFIEDMKGLPHGMNGLIRLVNRAVASDPEERISSAEEFLAELGKL